METLGIYLLKMFICSAVLYGYYRAALFNERFHQWNRFYLLSAMLLSVVVPFVNIPLFTQQPVVVTAVSAMPWNFTVNANPAPPTLSWQQVVAGVGLVISSVLLIRILVSVVRLMVAYRRNPVSSLNEQVRLILTGLNNAPFSFFNWLFWRQDIDPESSTGQRMLQHELTHIRERHSYDKLFTELLICVFWINPFFWLMRKELEMIHEFLADRKAIEKQDGQAFAEMILQAIHVQPQYALTNPFFSSQIKRRLLMITTSKTPKYTYLRRISGLVTMVASAIVLTLTVQQAEAQKQDKKTEKKADEKDKQYNNEADAKGKKVKDSVSWVPAGKANLVIKADTIFIKDANGKTSVLKDGQGKTVLVKSVDVDNEQGKVTATTSTGEKLLLQPMPDNQSPKVVVASDAVKIRMGVGLPEDGKAPLYIVNGIPLENGGLEKINPNDIESISVLKDASSTALYGEKGANGVVLVALKKGLAEGEKLKEIIVQGYPSGAKNQEVKEVVVTGYGREKPLKEVVVQGKPSEKKLELKEVTVQGYATKPDLKMKEVTVVGFRGINEPTNPIYVLDGKRISAEEFKSVAGEGVEAITVLKDQSAISKYGDDGKNGVIELTTKPIANNFDKVFTKTEQMPVFPGGADAWRKYLERNLQYPEQARLSKTTGVATVQFVVDDAGNLSNFKAIGNPGAGLGEEAIRVIKNGPKWEPAEQSGKKVPARIEQKITFQLN